MILDRSSALVLILDQFWIGSGSALHDSATVSDRFWIGSGSGSILYRFGSIMDRFWIVSGSVLDQNWLDYGLVPDRF